MPLVYAPSIGFPYRYREAGMALVYPVKRQMDRVSRDGSTGTGCRHETIACEDLAYRFNPNSSVNPDIDTD